MTDKKNFEQEYQYVEESGSEDNQEFAQEVPEKKQTKHDDKTDYISKINQIIQQPNIRRNGLIAFGGLIFLILVLKHFSKDDFEKTSTNVENSKPTEKIAPLTNPLLQTQAAQKMPSLINQNIEADHLADIERNVQSSVSSIRDEIGQLNNQINTLTTTNQSLISEVSQLSAKLAANQQVLEELLAAKKANPVIPKTSFRVVKHQSKAQSLSYYVQAVIPGRAWLINSQGGNLTVRVGSKVPGLGVVHRIDALQGRVTMSSGRIIAFTQAD